jgi:hypothetical protein
MEFTEIAVLSSVNPVWAAKCIKENPGLAEAIPSRKFVRTNSSKLARVPTSGSRNDASVKN